MNIERLVLPEDCSNYMRGAYPTTYETMTELPDEMKNADYSNVNNMDNMFDGCRSLKKY